jgi:hypothetical protein
MLARDILQRFMDALSCIDQCFIVDSMLEELPAPSSVGKTEVGGIDLNKARMRWVVEALIALGVSPSARGFTASELARQVRLLSNQTESDYGPQGRYRPSGEEQEKHRRKINYFVLPDNYDRYFKSCFAGYLHCFRSFPFFLGLLWPRSRVALSNS